MVTKARPETNPPHIKLKKKKKKIKQGPGAYL